MTLIMYLERNRLKKKYIMCHQNCILFNVDINCMMYDFRCMHWIQLVDVIHSYNITGNEYSVAVTLSQYYTFTIMQWNFNWIIWLVSDHLSAIDDIHIRHLIITFLNTKSIQEIFNTNHVELMQYLTIIGIDMTVHR